MEEMIERDLKSEVFGPTGQRFVQPGPSALENGPTPTGRPNGPTVYRLGRLENE